MALFVFLAFTQGPLFI